MEESHLRPINFHTLEVVMSKRHITFLIYGREWLLDVTRKLQQPMYGNSA
eukprot:CAMPEP_0184674412 /NCGR_PEP_ID=MMETSP0308-20130426/87219_1 /TAXON_ID=38269 /ORGANISM="Gloeochaete witrockiana, Strain SAG 46.84" /LENGTH=49 /DNA_ID=CAMNT_0027122007 /DNA_START=251 /DNA_END=400 /DNA_ORIENTATION=+